MYLKIILMKERKTFELTKAGGRKLIESMCQPYISLIRIHNILRDFFFLTCQSLLSSVANYRVKHDKINKVDAFVIFIYLKMGELQGNIKSFNIHDCETRNTITVSTLKISFTSFTMRYHEYSISIRTSVSKG